MTTLEKILQDIENIKEAYRGKGFSLERDDFVEIVPYSKADIEYAKVKAISEVIEIIKKHMAGEGSAESASPSRDNDKWIPCDPENIPDTEALCCDEYGEELIGYLSNTEEGWICESNECVMYYVVAWMPKPKPYRKDSE